MKPSFVFRMQHEGSRSKTITSHHNKALSVQQWQENCAFRQKTLYTLEMENELFFFWLMSIRYMVHSDKWEETTRCTERKLQQKKKQFHEILMRYIYWQATRTSSPLQGLQGERERERACAWLTTTRCRGTCTRTACTHRHRNTLIHALVKLWLDRSKDNPSHTPWGHWQQCVCWECQRHDKEAYMWLHTCSEQYFFLVLCSENPIIWG